MNLDPQTVLEISRLTTICLAVAIGSITLFGVVALFRAPEQTVKLMFALIESDSVVRMGTAIVIVIAIFGLRITDRVSAEATIATLSGIAGYLLGGRTRQRNHDAKSGATSV